MCAHLAAYNFQGYTGRHHPDNTHFQACAEDPGLVAGDFGARPRCIVGNEEGLQDIMLYDDLMLLPPEEREQIQQVFFAAQASGHVFEAQPEHEVSESGRRDVYRCVGCGARVVLCYTRGSDQPFEPWLQGKAVLRCPAPPLRSEKPPAMQDSSVAGPDGAKRALEDLHSALRAVARLRRAARHCELAVAMTGFTAEDLDSKEHDLDSAIAAFQRARDEVRAVKRDRLRTPPGGAGA